MNYNLQNGISLPNIGFGTSELNPNKALENILFAVKTGYRLFDTAPAYNTEKFVGEALALAIKEGIVTRKELIIETKLSNEDQGYKSTLRAFERSLNILQTDYIDIYLIHWPIPKDHENDYSDLNKESWLAMEELFQKGKIKTIGVCNFLPKHLKNIINGSSIKPLINQIELHPEYQEEETINFCYDNNIQIEAWAPFRKGLVFKNKYLLELVHKNNISISELVMAWLQYKNAIPLIKSDNFDHIKANFELSKKNYTSYYYLLDSLKCLDNPDCHMDYWNYKRQLKY